MEFQNLNEIATANAQRIQSENAFIRETKQAAEADPQWNRRMSEYMIPIWKLRSKIEDLKMEVEPLMKEIRARLDSINEKLAKEIETGIKNWNRDKFNRFGRMFYPIEHDLESSSTSRLKLTAFEDKTARMVKRAQGEAISYLVNENSTTTMDPGLNMDVIREFIIYGLQTYKISSGVYLEHNLLVDYCYNSLLTLFNREMDFINRNIAIERQSEDPNFSESKSDSDSGNDSKASESSDSESDCQSDCEMLTSSNSIQPQEIGFPDKDQDSDSAMELKDSPDTS